jgi:hypothetical protein
MLSPLPAMVRSLARPRPSSLWTAAAVACLLSCEPAAAQTASDPRLQNPRIQSAYSEWRKLPQKEVDCVDQTLRTRRSSLWLTIQRGINPSDATVAAIRAGCRAQARAAAQPRPAPSATQALASVDAEATRRAADRLAAEKAAEKALADKVAAEIAASKKAAADRIAAEKIAAQKAAEDETAADRIAAEKAAAAKAAADKTERDRTIAQQAAADKVAMDPAKDDAAPISADAVKATTDAERAPPVAAKMTADAALAHSAGEARISFVYGLVSGPIIFSFGGVVFLLLRRKKAVDVARPEAAAPGNDRRNDQGDFNRLVAAVLAEQARRDGKQRPPIAPERQQRTDEAALH